VTTSLQEGSTLADKVLEQLGRMVGDNVKASTIFGEPVEREGITVIPVARARFGFGGGGGAGGRDDLEGTGGGGGGGAIVTPVGYIELHDGTATFRRIRNPTDVVLVAVAASLVALVVRRLLPR
jgi:uncharacterized spore protein YtfJ